LQLGFGQPLPTVAALLEALAAKRAKQSRDRRERLAALKHGHRGVHPKDERPKVVLSLNSVREPSPMPVSASKVTPMFPPGTRSATSAPLLTLVLAVIGANSAGNFALRVGMAQVGRTVSLSPLPYLSALLNPWVLTGVALLIGWLILQLSLLSRADLAYVLPITAMANTVAALLGAFVLYERVTRTGWIGIALITIGAWLVGQTDSRTDSGVEGPVGELGRRT
jgi:uncharacterized membrane protein